MLGQRSDKVGCGGLGSNFGINKGPFVLVTFREQGLFL